MILREFYTKLPVAGAVSWNTFSDLRGVMEQLIVNSSTTSTTFDFSLTDDNGNIVYNKKGNKGTLIDDSKVGLYGIYTMSIANSSSNSNSFTTTLMWREHV
jgi:hypothetical protein